jgi:hypothetical protein
MSNFDYSLVRAICTVDGDEDLETETVTRQVRSIVDAERMLREFGDSHFTTEVWIDFEVLCEDNEWHPCIDLDSIEVKWDRHNFATPHQRRAMEGRTIDQLVKCVDGEWTLF